MTSGALRRFRFRFAAPFRLAAMPFLVHPDAAWVTVDPRPGGLLTARYGPWCVQTEIANVRSAEVTGPYGVLRTIGPARLSMADRGLTFASNRDRGVCIRFVDPVGGIDAFGLMRHPGLTVTVDDVAGLVDVLRRAAGTEAPD